MSATTELATPALPAARRIERIVLHCTATRNGRPVSPREIDDWHGSRGFHRTPEWIARFNPRFGHVGYHYMIDVGGRISIGRHLEEIGAHVKGHNADSVGIALSGTDAFTVAQWTSLAEVVRAVWHHAIAGDTYPGPWVRHDTSRIEVDAHRGPEIVGHRDLNPAKLCPGFDVRPWIAGGMVPPSRHVLK